jgi:ankyrin repeat protein
MANLNEQYNKKIIINPIIPNEENESFDLCFFTYYGKLTNIVEIFNGISIDDAKEIVNNSFTEEKKRNSLQIASFLNFSNIFLYLLTYDADYHYQDENQQNTWHFLCYRGHSYIINLLINYIRYKIKYKYLNLVDKIKKDFGFSNLDIFKGKLSKAVHKTEEIVENFNKLQNELYNECNNMINEFIEELKKGLMAKDKEGQTPLHLAAMSKFPLCQKIINEILDFDFFNLKDVHYDEFLKLFFELQTIEIKQERMNEDPRRVNRLERELCTLLGDDIIKELSDKYKKDKNNLFKEIINTVDNNGDTILHISSFCGDYRIVKKLLIYGGNKKLKNNNEKLPVDLSKDNFVRKVLTNLNKAAKNSEMKNITELVNFGDNINEKISIFRQAPIHKIIESKKKNKHEVLKNMLEMGSDPNLRDSNGWTPLHYACNLGDFESVKILIEIGQANIDSYSNNKRIPLHYASYNNFSNIVEYLCENESDVNYKDNLGCSPLHLSAKNGNTKCLDILLKYGGDLYSVDFRGWNILHYSAFHGHKKTVRFISKYDADYDILKNMRNSQNKLPIEIVRDPEVKKYFNSLWHAAKEGNLDLTVNLLNDGEDVNQQSQFEKNTPLILATLNAHYLEVRLLLEHKASIDIKNKDDKTASDYASEMFEPCHNIYKMCNDLDREKIDLRNIIWGILNKSEDILNATICKSNWDLKIWKLNDFVTKICKIFGLQKEEKKEKNNEEEKEENKDKKIEAN